MGMIEFINHYLVEPIYNRSGYNQVNTIVFGLALGFSIIYLMKVFERLRLRVDRKFAIGFGAFAVPAAFLRTLVDAKLLPTSFFLITPGIFLTIFVIAFTTFILTYKRRPESYNVPMIAVAALMSIYPAYLAISNIITLKPMLYVFMVSAVTIPLSIAMFRLTRLDENRWTKAIFAANFFDVSTTVVAIEFYGYFEEHYYENLLINWTGTSYILFPLKFVVIGIVIYLLQRSLRENEIKVWYFAIALLGLAAGLRDLFTMILIG